MSTYSVEPAKYAKGKLLVRFSKDGTGLKDRAQRILFDGLNCRYTGRENGLIASPTQVARFEKLLAEGWDACSFSKNLVDPDGNIVEKKSRMRS